MTSLAPTTEGTITMLHIVYGESSDTKHHHDTVAQARDCEEAHSTEAYFDHEADAERRDEMRYEMYLESPAFYSDGGMDTREEDEARYWESLLQEDALASSAL